MKIHFLLAISFGMLTTTIIGSINFRSKSSGIQLSEETALKLESPIAYCPGQIIKKKGSSIHGHDIFFDQGTLDEDGNRMKIIGRVTSNDSNRIFLRGYELFKGKGSSVIQELIVQGPHNRIEGDLLLDNDIILLDTTAGLTCAIIRRLTKNIVMNGGSITLEENLNFVEDKKIIGHGTIWGNNRAISLGANTDDWHETFTLNNINPLVMNSSIEFGSSLTFQGERCSIDGNGHTITFTNNGQIIVDRHSTLHLKNITLHNLENLNVRCMDQSSKIIFQDVTLIPKDIYSFSQGSFCILGYLDITGSSTFVFNTNLTCTIADEAILYLSNGMTFSYDPPLGNKHLLTFSSKKSEMRLQGARIHVTRQGLQLTTGALLVKNLSSIACEQQITLDGLVSLDEGLTLGNDDASLDCGLYIAPGSMLKIARGNFIYRNVNSSSLSFGAMSSALTIAPKSILSLYQPMGYSFGRIQLYDNATLINQSGSSIDGSVEIIKG